MQNKSSLVGLLDYVIWPEALTDGTKLILLSLFVAVRTKFEILRPLILPAFSSLSGTTLFTLDTFLTMKIYICK